MMDEIIKFAKKQGYSSAEHIGTWNGYDVYEPLFNGNGIPAVGLPLAILTKGKEIRMSTPDEAMKILDEL